MNFRDIRLKVELDSQNIPEKIFWKADDSPYAGLTEAAAVTLSMWDSFQKETLRIDLWAKEMPIDEMKRFYIDTIAGLAKSLKESTGDKYMSEQMEKLCDILMQYLKKNSHKK